MSLPAGIELLEVTPEDATFLQALFATTRLRELALLPGGEGGQRTFLRIQYAAQDQSHRRAFPQARQRIVALRGTPIGRLYVDHSGEPLHLIDIALLPEHRGRGIGTALLQMLLDEASARGTGVSLRVAAGNPALRLYERLGFSTVSGDDMYVTCRSSPAARR